MRATGSVTRVERGTISQIIQRLGGMTKWLAAATYERPTRIFAPTSRTFERPSIQREGALFCPLAGAGRGAPCSCLTSEQSRFRSMAA